MTDEPNFDKETDTSRSSIPKATIARLSLYLRELEHLQREGKATTSSNQLGQRLGCTDAQVRKDFAHFGQFGYPGVGYRIPETVEKIRSILGTNQTWSVALVGGGNLGRALIGYKGFTHRGFKIEAIFDQDSKMIGSEIEGIQIHHIDALPNIVKELKIRLGIVAVPANSAQSVVNRLVKSGIRGILNFAPVTISLPDDVRLVSVDLAIELEQLSFAVVNKE